jgi:hypothetical protein
MIVQEPLRRNFMPAPFALPILQLKRSFGLAAKMTEVSAIAIRGDTRFGRSW